MRLEDPAADGDTHPETAGLGAVDGAEDALDGGLRTITLPTLYLSVENDPAQRNRVFVHPQA